MTDLEVPAAALEPGGRQLKPQQPRNLWRRAKCWRPLEVPTFLPRTRSNAIWTGRTRCSKSSALGMPSSIADGLRLLDQALQDYNNNPQLLERSRRRFSQSPRSLQSPPSATTTVMSISMTAEEVAILEWKNRKVQLKSDSKSSLPANLFERELEEESRRLWSQNWQSQTRNPPGRPWQYKWDEIWDRTERRWRQRGIWSDHFTRDTMGQWGGWKHEQPLDSSSEEEVEVGRFLGPILRRRKKQSTETDMQRKRAQRAKERAVTRPFAQFLSQLSFVVEELYESDPSNQPMDAASQVYQQLREQWEQAKIWDERWGAIPGMRWMHEGPVQELYDYYLPPPQPPFSTGDQGVNGAASPRLPGHRSPQAHSSGGAAAHDPHPAPPSAARSNATSPDPISPPPSYSTAVRSPPRSPPEHGGLFAPSDPPERGGLFAPRSPSPERGTLSASNGPLDRGGATAPQGSRERSTPLAPSGTQTRGTIFDPSVIERARFHRPRDPPEFGSIFDSSTIERAGSRHRRDRPEPELAPARQREPAPAANGGRGGTSSEPGRARLRRAPAPRAAKPPRRSPRVAALAITGAGPVETGRPGEARQTRKRGATEDAAEIGARPKRRRGGGGGGGGPPARRTDGINGCLI